MKKPRSDATLKLQHPARQLQLWKWCQNPKQSYTVLVGRIKKEWDVDTSEAALSGWYSWYPFSNKLTEFKSMTDQVTERLKRDPDPEQVSKASHVIFETLAAQTLDSKLFIELRKLRLQEQERSTQLRRLELLEKEFSEATETVGNSKLSDAEKAARIREIFKRE